LQTPSHVPPLFVVLQASAVAVALPPGTGGGGPQSQSAGTHSTRSGGGEGVHLESSTMARDSTFVHLSTRVR